MQIFHRLGFDHKTSSCRKTQSPGLIQTDYPPDPGRNRPKTVDCPKEVAVRTLPRDPTAEGAGGGLRTKTHKIYLHTAVCHCTASARTRCASEVHHEAGVRHRLLIVLRDRPHPSSHELSDIAIVVELPVLRDRAGTGPKASTALEKLPSGASSPPGAGGRLPRPENLPEA